MWRNSGEAGSSSISLRSQWTWTSTVRDSPRVVVAPDVLEELVAGEHLARVAEQEREQLERLGLERHGVAVAQHAVAGEVDLDPAEVDERRRVAPAARLLGPPEDRPDPRRQLAQAERLGDVVVGAELEADDLVDLGVLAR